MTDSPFEQSETPTSYYTQLRRQFFADIKDKWWDGVIAILAITAILIAQFKTGSLAAGQEWSSVFWNVAPSLLVLFCYGTLIGAKY